MKQLTLPALPYAYDALEPVISKEIMTLHHDKHHAAYVTAYNAAIEKPEKTREVMRDISFNYNGAKLHEIFWQNMRPASVEYKILPKLEKVIVDNFGSFENFKRDFTTAAVTVEGSGWAVLWKNEDDSLSIGQLEKHNLLGINGAKMILVLDVWEHAYYLDYKNARADYVNKWWDIVNWDDVESRL